MTFAIGQVVEHLGTPGADPTIYDEPELMRGRRGVITAPGTGGWDWWVDWEGGSRSMVDSCQIRHTTH